MWPWVILFLDVVRLVCVWSDMIYHHGDERRTLSVKITTLLWATVACEWNGFGVCSIAEVPDKHKQPYCIFTKHRIKRKPISKSSRPFSLSRQSCVVVWNWSQSAAAAGMPDQPQFDFPGPLNNTRLPCLLRAKSLEKCAHFFPLCFYLGYDSWTINVIHPSMSIVLASLAQASVLESWPEKWGSNRLVPK